MTKAELAQAQALHGAIDDLRRVHEKRHPGDLPFKDDIAQKAYAAERFACDAFFMLCGRFHHRVPMTDLSTENPAEWARKHKPYTYSKDDA